MYTGMRAFMQNMAGEKCRLKKNIVNMCGLDNVVQFYINYM